VRVKIIINYEDSTLSNGKVEIEFEKRTQLRSGSITKRQAQRLIEMLVAGKKTGGWGGGGGGGGWGGFKYLR